MTGNETSAARRPSLTLTFVLVAQMVLIAVLAYSIHRLQADVRTSHAREANALEMVLATYTLRQSSDYLTRFARRYAVTGDPAWRDVYRQVLDIRRGESLRPKDYESIYWDLIEPYRSNAHPLLYPQSLRSILEGLPFTPAELAMLEEAEGNSDTLAQVEQAAFQAVAAGRHEEAIDALFSVDYLRAKHNIMQPIDELMVHVRERIEQDREATYIRDRRLMNLIIGVAVLTILAGILFLLLAARRGRPDRTRTPDADPVP